MVFKAGKRKMLRLIDRYVSMSMGGITGKILHHIKDNARYFNVTGNTMGSISCGIYKGGNLMRVDQPFSMLIQEPTLKKGETRTVGRTSEGKPIKYEADTGERKYMGDEEAVKLLERLRPSTSGYAVVFCIGTNYATYLEKTREKNVLTDSYDHVKHSGKGILERKLRFVIDKSSGQELPFHMPDSFEAPF